MNQANTSSRPFDAVVLGIFNEIKGDESGEVATYIPELAKADPAYFGLCLTMSDGVAYCAGDADVPFTIQSISKPFVYAMALQCCGPDEVRKHVGVEPSGEAFNSISLEPGSGRPLNSMINAGAIAVSSLIYRALGDKALEAMLEFFSAFTGRAMEIDESVYRSESQTGHRNRAIAHLLRNFELVGDPVEQGVDLYFRQCSILVSARDLAMMGATLANRGVNPVTGRQAVALGFVDDMLSVMTTCGMYDYAGQWLYEVGLPAKSGVSGGIAAMLPGRMGIGVYSPRLDSHGNSVRGVRVCKRLSDQFRLHLFSAVRPAKSVIRRSQSLRDRRSRCIRSGRDLARLKELGASAMLFELQGDIQFSGMEAVQRHVWESAAGATHVVLDFTRVDSLDHVAIDGLVELVCALASGGREIAMSGEVPRQLREVPLAIGATPPVYFADLDAALEACESGLLYERPIRAGDGATDFSPAGQLELADRLGEEGVAALNRYVKRRGFAAGTRICGKGESARDIYFLVSGTVTVRLPLANGTARVLAKLGPGTVFGEMAAIDRGTRSSDIWADSDAECLLMPLSEYDRMGQTNPDLKTALLEYLLGVLTARLRNANDQIAALAV